MRRKPSPPIARAWSDAAAHPESGSTAAHRLHRAHRVILLRIRGRPIHRLVGDFSRHQINCRRDRCRLDAGRRRRGLLGALKRWQLAAPPPVAAGHDWATWRNVLQDPGRARSAGRAQCRGCGNDATSSAGTRSINGQARVDAGAVLGIDWRRQSPPRIATRPCSCRRLRAGPRGIVGRDVRACDGHQPSALGKTGQSGSDVP